MFFRSAMQFVQWKLAMEACRNIVALWSLLHATTVTLHISLCGIPTSISWNLNQSIEQQPQLYISLTNQPLWNQSIKQQPTSLNPLISLCSFCNGNLISASVESLSAFQLHLVSASVESIQFVQWKLSTTITLMESQRFAVRQCYGISTLSSSAMEACHNNLQFGQRKLATTITLNISLCGISTPQSASAEPQPLNLPPMKHQRGSEMYRSLNYHQWNISEAGISTHQSLTSNPSIIHLNLNYHQSNNSEAGISTHQSYISASTIHLTY